MALSSIRTAIKTILEGVSGIGIVHDYERWANDWNTFLEFYKTGGKINGWSITRKATPAKKGNVPTMMRTHNFVIRGYYGLQDSAASEKTFQDLVEAVQDAFDAADHQLGLPDNVLNSGPVQVKIVENRFFGKSALPLCGVSFRSSGTHHIRLGRRR